MKVTTDACIQGAWTPVLPAVKRILDIGTGTGLLSLMLAQKDPSIVVDAVEYDEDAALQAIENFQLSQWTERLNVFKGDVRTIAFQSKYDLIISNPPFFNNSLLSQTKQKSMARHTTGLSYNELIQVIAANLAAKGYASVLLPCKEYSIFRVLATEAGLHECGKLLVKHIESAAVKRIVGLFSLEAASDPMEEPLIIKDIDGHYTQKFTSLLGPFYFDL